MDTLQDIKTKTDEEILAEIKTLNVEISRRRQRETKKKKQPTEEPVKRGRPKKTDQTQSEQTQSEQPTEEVKRYRAEWRHKPDGKYDSQPIDPEYHKNYWREHFRNPYTCDICNRTILCCGSSILRHKNSQRCQLIKLKNEIQPSN